MCTIHPPGPSCLTGVHHAYVCASLREMGITLRGQDIVPYKPKKKSAVSVDLYFPLAC